MAIGKSSSSGARRREVRRSMGKPRVPWLESITRREVCWIVVHVLVFVVVGSLVSWSAQRRPKPREGQQVFEAVYARVEFEAVDEQATTDKMEDAGKREPAIYVHNEIYLEHLREKLIGLAQLGMESLDPISEETRRTHKLDEMGLTELERFVHEGKPTSEWEELTNVFLDNLARVPALSKEDFLRERAETQRAQRITIKHPNDEFMAWWDPNLVNVEEDGASLRNRFTRLAEHFPEPLRPSVAELVMENLQPIYLLDDKETEQRKQAAYEKAGEQQVKLERSKNALLVKPGDTLGKRAIQLLGEEQRAYRKEIGPLRRAFNHVAEVALIAMLGVGLWRYVYLYKRRVIEKAARGFALTGLVLVGQALAVAFSSFNPTWIYLTATLFTLLITVVVAIAYDQRFALAVGALHAVLVTMSLALPVGFILILLTGVAVTAGQLHEVRNRSKLLWVGIWTGSAMFAAAWIVGLTSSALHVDDVLLHIFFNSLKSFGSGLLAGLLAQSILPGIEKVFKVTTSMTLKELNDASHPLLRRLAQEAPGTYQHSLRLSDMTEAAAEVIGADGLLCKVGAMYHDVGKMHKPLYFVENQGGGANRHDKLSPAMSVLIIIGHVKDGVEMSREYRLPPVLRHFIESHHGTTLVEYFYHAAKQNSEESHTPIPTEFEFRYPGPKPQTKEAGIMLLGDNIESAARTLPEPTPVRLEQLAHQIATKRLMDGQFDQCNLTLQELHKVEQSMTKTLCAAYHARVKYPEDQSKVQREPEAASQSRRSAAS